MREYRRLHIFAVAALVFVLVVGLGGTLTARREIFPFASWLLFSLVPGQRSEFDLLLRTTADQSETGRAFNQADGLVYHPHSIVAHEIIQQLGEAEQTGNTAASRALRRQLEREIVPSVARYDLVRVTYTPIERWQTGRILATGPVRSFTVGSP